MGKKKRSRADGEEVVEKKSKKKDKSEKKEEPEAKPAEPAPAADAGAGEGSLLTKAMALAKSEGISIVAALTKLKSGSETAKQSEPVPARCGSPPSASSLPRCCEASG